MLKRPRQSTWYKPPLLLAPKSQRLFTYFPTHAPTKSYKDSHHRPAYNTNQLHIQQKIHCLCDHRRHWLPSITFRTAHLHLPHGLRTPQLLENRVNPTALKVHN